MANAQGFRISHSRSLIEYVTIFLFHKISSRPLLVMLFISIRLKCTFLYTKSLFPNNDIIPTVNISCEQTINYLFPSHTSDHPQPTYCLRPQRSTPTSLSPTPLSPNSPTPQPHCPRPYCLPPSPLPLASIPPPALPLTLPSPHHPHLQRTLHLETPKPRTISQTLTNSHPTMPSTIFVFGIGFAPRLTSQLFYLPYEGLGGWFAVFYERDVQRGT